jgi:hypothetical protein
VLGAERTAIIGAVGVLPGHRREGSTASPRGMTEIGGRHAHCC